MRRAARKSRPVESGTEWAHIHLPSVHARDGNIGFDYEEDLTIRDGGKEIDRLITLAIVAPDARLVRMTLGKLCAEEIAQLAEDLPVLMDEDNPASGALMRESAQEEFERQLRILSGAERACLGCGCSESRACSATCVWVKDQLCSNCAWAVSDQAALPAADLIVVSEHEADVFIQRERRKAAGA